MNKFLPPALLLAACTEPPATAASIAELEAEVFELDDPTEGIVDAEGRTLYLVRLTEPAVDGFAGADDVVAARTTRVAEVRDDHAVATVSELAELSPVFSAFLDAAQVAELAADPRVQSLVADRRATLSYAPVWSDGVAPGGPRTSYGTMAVNATASYPPDGRNARVYIVDTGAWWHADHNWIERVNALDPGPIANAIVGCSGHAYHVAGIVGARDNNWGSRGVAPNAPMVSVSLMDAHFLRQPENCADASINEDENRSLTMGAMTAAFNWIAQDVRTRNVPAVVNLSANEVWFGSNLPAYVGFQEDIRRMTTPATGYRGALLVQSAGNQFDTACKYAYHGTGAAVVVGALDDHGQPVEPLNEVRAFRNLPIARTQDGSNYGTCVDMWAPGDRIYSSWKDQGFMFLSGTSMAAPHVTGLVYVLSRSGDNANGLVTSLYTRLHPLGAVDHDDQPVSLATYSSQPAAPHAVVRAELRADRVAPFHPTVFGFSDVMVPSYTVSLSGPGPLPSVGIDTTGLGASCVVERRRSTERNRQVWISATADAVKPVTADWGVGTWIFSSPCVEGEATVTLTP